jgi:hypothetical protein
VVRDRDKQVVTVNKFGLHNMHEISELFKKLQAFQER